MEKLSTLMRQGNQYPQVQGVYIKYDDDYCVTGACALGAIVLGAKLTGERIDIGSILDELDIRFIFAEHPTTKIAETLWSIITDLNDRLQWPIAQIADWLESAGY